MPRSPVDRLIGAPNIPLPTYSPVASPIDTFYQPQPQIPGEAVDNTWLQLAKAMQGLAPSLKGFLQEQEKQKAKKDPSKAEKAAHAFMKRQTDEHFRENYKQSEAERKIEIEELKLEGWTTGQIDAWFGEDEAQAPGPEFDLEGARSKYRQQRLALARQYVSMGRKEGAEWLEANQNLFPGVTLTSASRPDFQLHLKKQLGMAWQKEAKVFEIPGVGMDTAENALSHPANFDAFIASEDKDEWLRQFEEPIAEGLSSEGQAFREGAMRVWNQTRQIYKARALNIYDTQSANKSKNLQINRVESALLEIGNEAGFLLTPNVEPKPGESLAEKAKREALNDSRDAKKDELAGVIYETLGRTLVGRTDSAVILFSALEQAAEKLQDTDDSDEMVLYEQMLDRAKSLPLDPNKPDGKTVGQRYAKEFRDIEERLESRAYSQRVRDQRGQGDRTTAAFYVKSYLLGEFAARTTEPGPGGYPGEEKLETKEEIMDWVNTQKPQIMEILTRELGATKADRAYNLIADGAADSLLPSDPSRTPLTPSQQKGVDKLTADIFAGTAGSKAAVIQQLNELGIRGTQQAGPITLYDSEEGKAARATSLTTTLAAMTDGFTKALPDNLINATDESELHEVKESIIQQFREDYNAADTAERKRLAGVGPAEALKKYRESEVFKKVVKRSRGFDAPTLVKEFRPGIYRVMEQYIQGRIPDEIPDPANSENTIPVPQAAHLNMVAGVRARRAFHFAMEERLKSKDKDGKLIYGDLDQLTTSIEPLIEDVLMGTVHLKAVNTEEFKSKGVPLTLIMDQAVAGAVTFMEPKTDPGTTEEQLEKVAEETKRTREITSQSWTDNQGKIQVQDPGGFTLGEKLYEAKAWYLPDYIRSYRAATPDVLNGMKTDATELLTKAMRQGMTPANPRKFDPEEEGPGWQIGAVFSGKSEYDRLQRGMPSEVYANQIFLSARVLGLSQIKPLSWYEAPGDWVTEYAIAAGQESPNSARAALEVSYMLSGFHMDELLLGHTRYGVPLEGKNALWKGKFPWGSVPISAGDPEDYWADRRLYDNGKTREDSKLFHIIKKLGLTDKPTTTKGTDGKLLSEIELMILTQDRMATTREKSIDADILKRNDRLSFNIPRLNSASLGHHFGLNAANKLVVPAAFDELDYRTEDFEKASEANQDQWDWRYMSPTMHKLNERSRTYGKDKEAINAGVKAWVTNRGSK